MAVHNTYNVWTTGQEQQLRELYGTIPGKELAKRLGVTLRALRVKASNMGITRRKTSEVWLPEQIEVLQATYPIIGSQCAPLCGRSVHDVRERAHYERLYVTHAKRPAKNEERRRLAIRAAKWCVKHGMTSAETVAVCASVCDCTEPFMRMVLPELLRIEARKKAKS